MDIQKTIATIIERFQRGDISGALELSMSATRECPNNYQIVGILAQILERIGRVQDAAIAYEQMTRISPGSAVPFTKRSTLLLRQQWGSPPLPRPADGRKKVTMSTIGSNGRFGNQILQYAFLRIYADTHGFDYETNDWIGRDLFGLNDPYMSSNFPTLDESDIDVRTMLSGEQEGPHSVDFLGYFGKSAADFWRHGELIKEIFSLSPPMLTLKCQLLDSVGKDNTIIAIHIRRGDFGHGDFWLVPVEWYLDWLSIIWGETKNPVLYIASDDRMVAEHFNKYSPLTFKDMPAPPNGIEFMTDHLMLANARVVAMANSTFSYSAALLNNVSSSFYKPSRSRRSLVPCDPWREEVAFP